VPFPALGRVASCTSSVVVWFSRLIWVIDMIVIASFSALSYSLLFSQQEQHAGGDSDERSVMSTAFARISARRFQVYVASPQKSKADE
jgi:hypothetical protein